MLTGRRAFFSAGEFVYIPCTNGRSAQLVGLEYCVWNGPSWLQSIHAVSLYSEYAQNSKVEYLFRDALHIPDADCGTYIAEFVIERDVKGSTLDHVRELYKAIMQDVEDNSYWKYLLR